ncbi:MAG: hypothetical protein WA144_05200, partial [Candidatus Methanoperedens sp.]
VTALTLAIGDDKLAQDLAIYAYYLLVTGVVIRFFELALPKYSLQKHNPPDMKRISLFSNSIKNHGLLFIRNMGIMLKNLYAWLQSRLRRVIFEMKVRISGFKRQFLKLRRLHIVNPGKNITLISEISMNIGIFLSVFFIFSLIYGITIDWWFVKGYLNNLIFTILGCFILYIVLRVRL